jgi:osmotically-inducible protein OsmY
MKRFIFTFLLGAAAGGFGCWYFTQGDGKAQFAEVQTNAIRVGEIVRTKAAEGYQDVMDELARTGMVVRDKAKHAGETVATAATDTRITAAVKTKLVGEAGLGSLRIGVETSAGVVTLTGEVTDIGQVTKAVNAALSVDGVSRVVSKLQVTSQKAG